MEHSDELKGRVTISAQDDDDILLLTPERMRELEADLKAHFEKLGKEFSLRTGIVPGSLFEEELPNGRARYVFPKEEGIGTAWCELVFDYSGFLALSRITKGKGIRPAERYEHSGGWDFSIDPDGNISGIGHGLRHIGQAVDHEQ